jgi:hypothetical protein
MNSFNSITTARAFVSSEIFPQVQALLVLCACGGDLGSHAGILLPSMAFLFSQKEREGVLPWKTEY